MLGSPVTVAVNCCTPPDGKVVLSGPGEIETIIPGTVMAAGVDTAESVAEVAVRVTIRLPAAGAAGAVYVVATPLAVEPGETLPQGACGHDTVQLTPALAPSLATVAENGACAPRATVAEMDERFTVTAGTVMTTFADFAGSLADVAVRVTVRAPACTGGVKVVGDALAVAAGETPPQGAVEHDTVQLTPLLAESLVTLAVNCAVAPTSTVAVALGSETMMGTGGGPVGELPQPKFMAASTTATGTALTYKRLLFVIGHP